MATRTRDCRAHCSTERGIISKDDCTAPPHRTLNSNRTGEDNTRQESLSVHEEAAAAKIESEYRGGRKEKEREEKEKRREGN